MKWIKKILSLFISKTEEGYFYDYGFNYLFQDGWYNDNDQKERTVFLYLPLPWNKYGQYISYMSDIVVEGERWLSIVIGFRYMKIGQKRIFKPMFYHTWAQIGNTKVIYTTYNMYLKGTLPK